MKNLDERMARVDAKNDGIKKIDQLLASVNADPEQVNPFLESIGSSPITQKTKIDLILSRPHVALENIRTYLPQLEEVLAAFDEETISLAEVDIKYRGYIEREQEMVDKMNRLEDLILHDNFDYSRISSLSHESREKLSA
jgi:tRNA uridine 5-carboxymethylaminomethyl modification enzyme